MKKIILLLLFVYGQVYGQIESGLLLGLTTGTTAEINATTGIQEGQMLYNSDTDQVMVFDGSAWVTTANANWLSSGNVLGTGDFLGSTNDVIMDLKSNATSVLQFGRRQSLGLTQNFPDYTDNDQYLTYLRGSNGTSALQFQADAASFYKPMFYTTPEGNFRLKGSAAGTDFFEIGSAGVSNAGEVEFIIADDGAEPFIFKRYDYRDQLLKELFRIQGASNSQNALPRVGINTAQLANSTLQVRGSVATAITTSSTNITLDETHHTIVITASSTITFPVANTCEGRVYKIKNTTNTDLITSTYTNNLGGTSATIPANASIEIQSNGSVWHILSYSGAVSATTIQVDQSYLWAGTVDDDDIHSTGTLTVNESRADIGWTFSAPSTITYSGTPSYLKINLMAVANNTGNHWAHPHIKVFRNGQEIGEGSGLYMDDSTTYSGRTTTVISMVDPNPGTNPMYTFTTLEDDNRTMNNPTITSLSPVSLLAIEKVSVVVSVSN
jgi:hypothetical protein